MTESWLFSHEDWSERWSRAGAAFDRVECDGRILRPGRDDLSALLPKRGDRCDCCSGPMPAGFGFCPDCGARLRPIALQYAPSQGAPNAAPAPGLEPGPFRLHAPAAEAMQLPPGQRLAFAVGGEPGRLLCIDRDNGGVHLFDPLAGYWRRCFGLGAGVGEVPGWSAAATALGVCVPLPDAIGMVELRFGPEPRLSRNPLPGGGCVGGAGLFNGEMLVPVRDGSSLRLARRRPVRGDEWRFDTVVGAPTGPWGLEAPMATALGIGWPGAGGMLLLSASDEPGLAAAPVWHPWPEGFEPLPGWRPFVDRGEATWCFGRARHRDAQDRGAQDRGAQDGGAQDGRAPDGGPRRFAFARMAAAAGQRETRLLDGPVLPAGRLCCRLNEVRTAPWHERSPYNREYPGRDTAFLLPVLSLGPDRSVLLAVEGRDRLAAFAESAGPGVERVPLGAGVRMRQDDALLDLGVPLELEAPSQVACFVFGHHLHLYDARENRCWRWTLQTPASPGGDNGADG
ncbi:hypothetical protein [Rhizosaccharibacter radicis]|uniref:DUF2169 domain-containing protein n=1 Tax=Rhizosaccharibacter radicis TaxID=2782605 RepID=A0ABT1VVJ9_9PROT|nr:hypothetical protein [Acetobacteraceae bacterium KSS12]